jgi:hypothetical protein
MAACTGIVSSPWCGDEVEWRWPPGCGTRPVGRHPSIPSIRYVPSVRPLPAKTAHTYGNLPEVAPPRCTHINGHPSAVYIRKLLLTRKQQGTRRRSPYPPSMGGSTCDCHARGSIDFTRRNYRRRLPIHSPTSLKSARLVIFPRKPPRKQLKIKRNARIGSLKTPSTTVTTHHHRRALCPIRPPPGGRCASPMKTFRR